MAEKVGHLHAGDRHRPLEGHEQAGPGPLVRLHRQKSCPSSVMLPAGDLVTGVPHDGEAQRALAGPIGSHQGMDLAAADVQVTPLRIGLPPTLTCKSLIVKVSLMDFCYP